MTILQTVTQVATIDWVPYVLSTLGALVLLFGGIALSDLRSRVKDLETENKKQEEARIARNEKIAEMFASRDLKVVQEISEIKEILAGIKP